MVSAKLAAVAVVASAGIPVVDPSYPIEAGLWSITGFIAGRLSCRIWATWKCKRECGSHG